MRLDAKHVKLVLGVAIAALVAGVALAQTPAVRAALVRDIDNPDRLPVFLDRITVNIAGGDNEQQVCTDPVPDGKVWVLDQVSIGLNAPIGQRPKAALGHPAVGTILAYLPLTDTGAHSDTLETWDGVWPLAGIRVGAGDTACIILSRYPVSAGGVYSLAILTGHLVDAR